MRIPFLLALIALSLAAAPTTNSASLYSHAFERIHADRDHLAPLDDVGKTPMDDATAKFLAERTPIVSMLRDAAKMPPAVWADSQGDVSIVLPPLNSARSSSSLMLLQSRYDLHQNQPEQAVDDALAALAVGRNIAQQKKFIAALVDIGIEFQAIDALGAELAVLPKNVAAALPAKLAALTKPLSWQELMDGEFEFGKAATAKQNLPPAMFEATAPFYKAVGAASSQPSQQFDQTVEAEATKLMFNPFVKTLAPTMKRVHMSFVALRAKQALLDTAIAVVNTGPDAVKQSKDPAGDGPFEYVANSIGFTLTSKATYNDDQAVTLRVGG